MPSHAIKGYYVMADLIEVRPTPHHPPSPTSSQPRPTLSHAVPCSTVPCHTVLGWSGLCWTDVTFHLPRQCTCNWLPRRSLTSDVVVVAVVAALTQFSVALRCVLGYSLDPVACNDDNDEGRTTTRSMPGRGFSCCSGFDFYHRF